MRHALTCLSVEGRFPFSPISPNSDNVFVFIEHYILILLRHLTVCIHGLGTTVNTSLCKCSYLWANFTSDDFAFFRKIKYSKQKRGYIITSSSSAIVKMLCHTVTLFVTPVCMLRGIKIQGCVELCYVC